MLRIATPLAFLLMLMCQPYASADSSEDPEQVVRSTTSEILGLINRNLKAYVADPSGFYAVVREISPPHFDLRSMARRAIQDQNWQDATEAQRDALVAQQAVRNDWFENFDRQRVFTPRRSRRNGEGASVLPNRIHPGREALSGP